MKKVALLLAVSLGSTLVTGCSGVRVAREQLNEPGALLFNGYGRPEIGCYRCHGGGGKGTARGPSLERDVPKHSADELFTIIREGSGKMPKYGPNKATDDEIKQIVAWLQGTFGQAPATN
jgi:mono/diheme cytochrome c family protein